MVDDRPQVVVVLGVLVVVLTVAAGLIWLERRLLALWQDRYGPNRVGPFGLLQVLADMIKIFTKEDWIPPFADRLELRLSTSGTSTDVGTTDEKGYLLGTATKAPGEEVELVVTQEAPGLVATPWKQTFVVKLPKAGQTDRYPFKADVKALRVVTFHVAAGKAAVAGATVGACLAAAAITAPFVGRFIDRNGARKVLAVTGIVYPAALLEGAPPAAADVLAYLHRERARRAFAAHGFTPLN